MQKTVDTIIGESQSAAIKYRTTTILDIIDVSNRIKVFLHYR